MQVLSGLFPISQVREPYSAIRYLAERVPIEKIYQLVPPSEEVNSTGHFQWTAFMLCEAYANKRGYHTKNGRPDTYRAALEILRDTVDGVVCLYFDPPDAARLSRLGVSDNTSAAVAHDDDDDDDDDDDEDSDQDRDQDDEDSVDEDVDES